MISRLRRVAQSFRSPRHGFGRVCSILWRPLKLPILALAYRFDGTRRIPAALKKSGLFDAVFYLERNWAVALLGIDPLWHYWKAGAREFRDPHPLFDTRFYLGQTPDVARSRANPLLHFVEKGAAQGYRPHPLFDTGYYLEQHPQLAESGANPLAHYLAHGVDEPASPSPFFDNEYYSRTVPEVAAARLNPLLHYVRFGASAGHDPSPLFDTTYYLRENPDVARAGLNPLAHYVRFGAGEGRLAYPAVRAIALVKPVLAHPAASGCTGYMQAEPEREVQRPVTGKVGVYASSVGNYFFEEIRDLIVEGLRRCGMQAVALSERSDRPSDLTDELVIAPHEFFVLGQGPHLAGGPLLRHATLLNTEQLHTPWFMNGYPWLRRAGAVLDMNIQTAAVLRRLGIPAHFLPLGYLQDYEPFAPQERLPGLPALEPLRPDISATPADPDAPLSARPIDLYFVGALSPRREQFFAQHRALFGRYRCFFHLYPVVAPLVLGQTAKMNTAAVLGISHRSKISLNIHQAETSYFEWQRIVFQGIWQRTPVITEPCYEVPWLRPGEHYFSCESAEIPALIQWILDTADGMQAAETMRRRAYEALKKHYDFETILAHLIARVLPGASTRR